jgi:hypothetical protein
MYAKITKTFVESQVCPEAVARYLHANGIMLLRVELTRRNCCGGGLLRKYRVLISCSLQGAVSA